MKTKYMLATGLICGMLFSSCYEDKGNYTYSDTACHEHFAYDEEFVR